MFLEFKGFVESISGKRCWYTRIISRNVCALKNLVDIDVDNCLLTIQGLRQIVTVQFVLCHCFLWSLLCRNDSDIRCSSAPMKMKVMKNRQKASTN